MSEGKEFTVKVKKLEFTTTGDGFVKPIARLTKTIKYDKKAEFDALMLDNALVVEANKICKTSQLDIAVCEDGTVRVDKFHPPRDYKHYKFPKKCSSCGTDLRSLGPDLVCVNAYCKGTDTGGLFRLFEMCNSTDVALLRKYLLNFPAIEENVTIGNLLAFLFTFKNVGPKNTPTRRGMYVRGDIYTEDEKDYLIALEQRIDAKLRGMTHEDIWTILNIPHFTIAQLEGINPRRITKKQTAKMTKTQQLVIEGGKKYFKMVSKLIDDFGGK
jgi:hypothetical protein